MRQEQNTWKDACSFEDYILSLFEKRETQSFEFKTLLRIYGREKIEGLWKKYKERKKQLEEKSAQPQNNS